MEKYTILEYQYSDASNYKAFHAIKLLGVISDSDIEEIRACMYDSEYFVPQKVGLPALQTLLSEEYNGFNEDDHDWHSIICIRPATLEDASLQIWGKSEQLVANFIATGKKCRMVS